MDSEADGMELQAITATEWPFQVQHEGFLTHLVLNTSHFLRQCRDADTNFQAPPAYRKRVVVGLSILSKCVALPSSMNLDLATSAALIFTSNVSSWLSWM